MRKIQNSRFAVILFALAGSAAVAHAQALVPTPSSISFSYTKGGSLPSSGNTVSIAPTGLATTTTPAYFTVEPSTVPSWLQVSPANGTATHSTSCVITCWTRTLTSSATSLPRYFRPCPTSYGITSSEAPWAGRCAKTALFSSPACN